MIYKQISIKTKLILGFGIVFGLVLVAGVFSVHTYLTTVKEFEVYLKGRLKQENTLWDIESNCRGMIHIFKDMVLRGENPAWLRGLQGEYNDYLTKARLKMEDLKKGPYLLTDGEERSGLLKGEKAFNDFTTKAGEAIKLLENGEGSKAADRLSSGRSAALTQSLTPLIESFRKKTLMESDRLLARQRRQAQGTLYFFIFSFILGGIFAVVTSSSISRPLRTLTIATEKIAQGDFRVNVAIKSGDEIGILAERFRGMVKNLNEILFRVKEATGQITAAGQQVLMASQQEVAASREQSSAVSETTSAAKELSVASEQVGESIGRVARAASQVLSGIVRTKDLLRSTGQVIQLLGTKSQQIGKMTDFINDVAEQTNLLAVNASIEATRAGEHGRGFAVVAEEIRKLADSTANSTKEITALIENIQHEISQAVISMQASVLNIEEEARLSQQTVEAAKEIAMNSTQQISGSRQIAEAMVSIDDAMKQVSLSAQQSQQAAKLLAQLAEDLQTMTEKFKVVS